MGFRANRPSRMSLSRASLSMTSQRTIQAVSNSPRLSRDPWAPRGTAAATCRTVWITSSSRASGIRGSGR